MTGFTLHGLEEIIAKRADEDPANSYTASLIEKGVERSAKKMGEEAVEAVIAAVGGERPELTSEIADLFYHTLVVMKARGVTLDEVMAELASRTGQSGHEEKAARG